MLDRGSEYYHSSINLDLKFDEMVPVQTSETKE
jgi:hypothetical protein